MRVPGRSGHGIGSTCTRNVHSRTEGAGYGITLERESERKTEVTRVCFYRAKRGYLLGGYPLWFTGVHSSLVAAALEFIDNRLPT